MGLNGWTRSPPNLCCCLSECHRLLVLWHKRLPDPTFWRQEWECGEQKTPRVSCASCASCAFCSERCVGVLFYVPQTNLDRSGSNGAGIWLQLARVMAWSIGVHRMGGWPRSKWQNILVFLPGCGPKKHTLESCSQAAPSKYAFIQHHRVQRESIIMFSYVFIFVFYMFSYVFKSGSMPPFVASLLRPQNAQIWWYGKSG